MAGLIRQVEEELAGASRLPAVLKGEDPPKDIAERLALAQMCYDTKRHAAAARFWAEALAADPKLGDDRRTRHRYNAACDRRLAAAGQGKDDPPPDDTAKAKLRGQALDWLKAELTAWARLLDAGMPQAQAPSSSRRSSTGRSTPTWPASATPTPWPSSPRPSGSTGRRSGRRSTPC